MFHHTHYADVLKEEFNARCRRNPRYSLRAYARNLDLSPSFLSEVLKGKHNLSTAAAVSTADRLGLSKKEKDFFLTLIEATNGASEEARELARVRLQKFRHEAEISQIADDEFRLIADWYHFGILELMNLKSFRSDPTWMAEALNISEADVVSGLDRLVRLGFAACDDGAYTPIKMRTFIGDNVPSEAIRKFHRQILNKANEASDYYPMDARAASASIFSIRASEVAEAKAMLVNFRREFFHKFRVNEQVDSVYCLSMQLFPLGEPSER